MMFSLRKHEDQSQIFLFVFITNWFTNYDEIFTYHCQEKKILKMNWIEITLEYIHSEQFFSR